MKSKLDSQIVFKALVAGMMSFAAIAGCTTVGDRADQPRPRTYPQLIAPKVTDEWNSEVKNQADRLRVETASVPGSQLTVSVNVLISRDGTVQGVRIAKSSGVRTMDELAMLTFHRISPLPPPPARAVHKGVAQVPWDFNLNK